MNSGVFCNDDQPSIYRRKYVSNNKTILGLFNASNRLRPRVNPLDKPNI